MVKTKVDLGEPLNPWFMNPVNDALWRFMMLIIFVFVVQRKAAFINGSCKMKGKKNTKKEIMVRELVFIGTVDT